MMTSRRAQPGWRQRRVSTLVLPDAMVGLAISYDAERWWSLRPSQLSAWSRSVSAAEGAPEQAAEVAQRLVGRARGQALAKRRGGQVGGVQGAEGGPVAGRPELTAPQAVPPERERQ